MATAESASKVCVVCGQNVAGKPRVKDAAGRYMCAGTCQEKAAAAAAKVAPPAAPRAAAPPTKAVTPPPISKSSGDGSLLNDLISSSPMLSAAACEQCGSPMPGGAVLCTRCGFNTQTGKAIKTAVIRDKEKKEPGVKPGKYQNKYAAAEAGPSFGKMLLIEALVLGGVGFLPLAGGEGFLAALIILGICGFIAWVGGLVAAFKNGQTIWGVCAICVIVPFVNIFTGLGFLVFNLLFNEDKYSRALYLSTLIGYMVLGGVIGFSIATGEKFELFGQTLGN